MRGGDLEALTADAWVTTKFLPRRSLVCSFVKAFCASYSFVPRREEETMRGMTSQEEERRGRRGKICVSLELT